MKFEQAKAIANDAITAHIGRSLSEAEIAILSAAWHGQTYEEVADRSGYSLNYLQRDVGPKFWKLLSTAFDRKLNKTNVRGILTQEIGIRKVESQEIKSCEVESQDIKNQDIRSREVESQETGGQIYSPTHSLTHSQIDWGEAIDVSVFYGRVTELHTLKQWIEHDRCKVIALLGMGGIGKSSLAAKMIDQVQSQFEFVIWRSLRCAPPLDKLLSELVLFLSHHQDAQGTIDRLLHWLRTHRCLVVLDNAETIMQAGDRVGFYQTGYENYGDLWRLLGETNHQSCVLLTSREKPAEIGTFEALDGKVRSLSLSGSWETSLALIAAKGLVGTDAEKRQLCEFYNCSPLALKIVASSIQSLFNGDIATFLAEETMVFNGLRRLLDQHFERLSDLERTIMYWLAINREWTSTTELIEDIVPTVSRACLLESLESLTWRSLVEVRSGKYTQQSVVMEYFTDSFIQNVSTELLTLQLSLFQRYALVKTTVLDYIRESQIRLILQPIAVRLTEALCSTDQLQQHLQQVLKEIRNLPTPFFGYGVGNVINLCLQLQIDLTDYDCSHFKIRQVNFQSHQFHQLNLAYADLKDCRFTQTFGGILTLAFSRDNRILALGDSNGIVRLWQTSSKQDNGLVLEQPLVDLVGHTSWVLSLNWHPTEQRLLTSSDDQTIKIWDIKTGQCVNTLQGHQGSAWWAVYSPDGTRIASAGGDRTIKLWDAVTGACLKTLQGHEGLIYSVAWNPDGITLASGGEDQTIRLWDVQTGQCLKTLTVERAWVRRVAWSPDGSILASASVDLQLWNGKTGQLLRTLVGHSMWIDSLAWSPDGKTLASSSSDQTIKLWNSLTGECLYTLQGHHDLIWGLHWSLDGKTLASGSHDQSVRLWNAELGQCRHVLQGYTNSIRSTAWSPDGRTLASSSTDKHIRIWDVETGRCLNTLTGHQAWIFSVDWSPLYPSPVPPKNASGILASGSADASIKLWDVKTGQCLRTLYGHTSWVFSVAWSPDGQRLASGSSLNDLTARIWNPATGECLKVLAGHQSWIWWVKWSPDGTLLATAADDQMIKIWDSQTGECLKTLHDDRQLGLTIAWSPDSQWLATSGMGHAVRIWNVQTGICEQELVGHGACVWAAAWSPDGQWLASASDDCTIKLWNLKTNGCHHTFIGHESHIWDISWNPDGTILASSSLDATIRLWDMATGDCLKVLRSDRPYEGMNITGITGITEAQKATLKALGAFA